MAQFYVQKLLEHNPTGPYNLGGWSLGFLIVLEMAQQLRKLGKNEYSCCHKGLNSTGCTLGEGKHLIILADHI